MRTNPLPLATFLIALLASPSVFGEPQGAAITGDYPNLFKSYLGKSDAEVTAKLEAAWNHFFRGDRETQSL